MARLFLMLLLLFPAPAPARQVVHASSPEATAVTFYRDPQRGTGDIDPDWPTGFAVISETRSVDLPAGPATIRFEGVAEGMVGVTAIVTGLPGGTIEQNRNAALLSPAALVDGTLGNRVTFTRTNPATGAQVSRDAVIRTRADGGLVLQTSEGYEALRCSGLPEKLAFDRIPDGLSAQPVFSVDTDSKAAGRHRVTISYIAAGFDWQANYLATLVPGGSPDKRKLRLVAWMTLANDNGQSFADATLLAVAGKLNVESDFRALSDPPRAEPLRLTCFATPPPPPAPPPPSPFMADYAGEIVVTAQRRTESLMATPAISVIAGQEELGDLKLYRVPQPITVAAKSLKQVAFLDKPEVRGTLVHRASCNPWSGDHDEPEPTSILLRTRNDDAHGLGIPLPSGKVAVFEPSSAGDLLLGEEPVRDYAKGQDVEIPLSTSNTVRYACQDEKDEAEASGSIDDGKWHGRRAVVTNANGHAIDLELQLAPAAEWAVRKGSGRQSIRDGTHVLAMRIPAGTSRTLRWEVRHSEASPQDDES